VYTFKSFFKFELSALVGLLTLAALLGSTASAYVLVTAQSQYSAGMIEIIVRAIIGFVVPYCSPFVVLAGVPAYFLLTRSRVIHLRKRWAVLTALIGMGAALECYPIIDQCEMSFYLRNNISANLTDAEKSTLKSFSGLMGSDGVCSIDFVYMQNGERLESMVRPDFIHGPKISTESLGTENGTSPIDTVPRTAAPRPNTAPSP